MSPQTTRIAESAERTRRRGRPANGDSAETRARLVDAARECFAVRGFDSTTIGDVARAADVVPSAFYHYFKGKEALYEAVFEETVAALWSSLEAAAVQRSTLREAIQSLIEDAVVLTENRPHHARFLVGLASEAGRRPQFSGLMERRTEMQRGTFRQLARLGLRTGELEGDEQQIAEQLRLLVVGWMTERHVSGAQAVADVSGLLRLLKL